MSSRNFIFICLIFLATLSFSKLFFDSEIPPAKIISSSSTVVNAEFENPHFSHNLNYSKYSGLVQKLDHAGGYSYLVVLNDEGERIELLSPPLDFGVEIGQQVYWDKVKVLTDYNHRSLNKRFDKIGLVYLKPPIPLHGTVENIKQRDDITEISLNENSQHFTVSIKNNQIIKTLNVGDSVSWEETSILSIPPSMNSKLHLILEQISVKKGI